MYLEDLLSEQWSGLESHLDSCYDRASGELDGREKHRVNHAVSFRKVHLDCSGELADLDPIAVLGLSESDDGVKFVEFVCPRCNERHESPRFE